MGTDVIGIGTARIGVVAALAVALTAQAADPLNSAVQSVLEGHRDAARTQQRIDDLSDETQALMDEYRTNVQRAQELADYNDQLAHLVAKQDEALARREGEITRAREIRARIGPLLRNMVHTLDEFVHLDAPFLRTERQTRIDDLKAMLDRTDVSLSEQYRRVMEAYQVEADYGRTLEASTEALDLSGQTRTVDVLRIGRVALLYLTFDGKEAGCWDRSDRAWKPLPPEYNARIARALQVARKEAPPEMLIMPLVGAVTAR